MRSGTTRRRDRHTVVRWPLCPCSRLRALADYLNRLRNMCCPPLIPVILWPGTPDLVALMMPQRVPRAIPKNGELSLTEIGGFYDMCHPAASLLIADGMPIIPSRPCSGSTKFRPHSTPLPMFFWAQIGSPSKRWSASWDRAGPPLGSIDWRAFQLVTEPVALARTTCCSVRGWQLVASRPPRDGARDFLLPRRWFRRT